MQNAIVLGQVLANGLSLPVRPDIGYKSGLYHKDAHTSQSVIPAWFIKVPGAPASRVSLKSPGITTLRKVRASTIT